MSTYLVTGCSRGLGLGLVQQLVQAGPSTARLIIGTSRSHQIPLGLQKLIDTSEGRLIYIALDVTNSTSIGTAVERTAQALATSGTGLDVLINNAGITVFEPERTRSMKGEDLARIFETNVVAVHNVTQAFLPLLRRGKEKKTSTLAVP